MNARIMWGTTGDDPVLIDADAVQRADDVDFTFLGRGEVAPSQPTAATTAEDGSVPAERVIYLVDDEGPQPIAVASDHVRGNADVLAAVEQEWKARTGRTTVRANAIVEPPAAEPRSDT
ncbi:MAG: hypothetical protein WAT66_16430 [Actinomycetota bacterium]